jgi:tetratricopeptide (TPR) repeat protein
MYDGQKGVALAAARTMVARLTAITPPRPPKTVEAELALPWHVLVRFGEWEAMVAEPAPAREQFALRAFWLEARAVSLSALHRLDEADAARADFEDAVRAVPDDYQLENNSVHDLLEVARPFVEGELDYRRGRCDRAFELLRVAVAREDALHFDEPAGWAQPVRHALGALLLEQGHVAEAEAVYREDLRRHPENGWSLYGLGACLHREGRDDEAQRVDDRFRAAWARADVVLAASCYCGSGTVGAGGAGGG